MQLPYGSWPSPVTAELLAAGGVGLSGPITRGDEIWWSELRPSEGGRVVPVSHSASGSAVDRLAEPWSARTRVHEYGGGAWWLGANHLYFTSWADQRLHRLALQPGSADGSADEAPEPITPEPGSPGALRYADGAEHPDGSWLVCIREDHRSEGEPANELVAVSLTSDGSEPVVLVTGPDFVSEPRFSPDGAWLSWIEWDHPAMPWDQTRLLVAPVTGTGQIGPSMVLAGAEAREAILGADWTSSGSLVFSTDGTGWWNLRSWNPASHPGGDLAGAVTHAVTDVVGAEIGHPPWVFGIGIRWCELADGRLAVAVTEGAADRLAVVTVSDAGEPMPLVPVPTDPGRIVAVEGLAPTADGRVAVVAAGARQPSEVLAINVDDGSVETIRPAEDLGIDPAWFSEAQPLSFPSGPDGQRTAHAFFYPPAAPDLSGPEGTAPPLVVMGHGGPTSHSHPGLRLKVQYWTSRGFAVADVNYGGSTGFGRAYKDLLQGAWGVVDVEDCIAVAAHLAEQGMVDANQMAIRGGSAGGLTVLAALQQSDLFAAGTDLFGVTDLTALAADTHKFESRYLDGLVGPYPEEIERYRERSPINHADKLSSPLLVMQGLEDEVVPPSQSEAIVAAVAAKGLPHAYVTFEGEQHGFRKMENVIRSFEVELWFYGRVFGFAPADEIAPPEGAVRLG